MGELVGIDLSAWPIWLNGLIFVATVYLIAKGADLFVDGASGIGRRLGISELVLGLTVVAIGTSAPEFAVSITAATKGQGDLAISNVVGSNVFNLGIILGGCAIIRTLPTGREVVYRDGMLLFVGTLAIVLLIGQDLRLGRLEGALLFGTLVAYLLWLIWAGTRKKKVIAIEPVPEGGATARADIALFAGGLLLVLIASTFMVDSASNVARAAGVSEWVIGVTIVAAGTSAPEMATSLVAALKGRAELSVGALIGSDLFNLFGVIGVAGMIRPVDVAPEARVSIIMFAVMVLAVLILMRSGWRLSRWEGVVLLALAIGRWTYDILASGEV